MRTTKRVIIFIFTILFSVALISGCKDEKPKYTITFVSNGGTSVETVTAVSGEKINEPAAPSRPGYEFLYWSGDQQLSSKYYFMSMPSQNIILYAKWQALENVKINYESNGGSNVEPTICSANTEYTLTAVSERTNYDFSGWYSDQTLQNKITTVTLTDVNIIVYAKWTLKIDKALIRYHTNQGTTEVVVDKGSNFKSLADGLEYENWYLNEDFTELITSNDKVNESIDVYGIGYTTGLKIIDGVVTAYSGADSIVVVPAIYQNQIVTTISSSAFYNNQKITEVMLPDTITTIEENAFYKCRYLVNINLSDALEKLGKFAFYECIRLVSVGNTLGKITIIEEGTFLGCLLLEEIVMPNTVTQVEDYAFGDCKKLAAINLSENLVTIGEYAFVDCQEITSFVIPATTTRIDTGAFKGCLSLHSVEVTTGNRSYITVDGNLLTYNRTTLILYIQGDKVETEYTIPTSIHTIRANAFFNNQNIVTLDVSNVETIEKGALYNMKALEELTIAQIENNITSSQFIAYFFGANAPEDNGTANSYVSKKLRKITFTDNFTEIPAYAFYGISSLKEIAGIENVTKIDDYAYAYTGIEDVNILANVTDISVTAFYGCENLVTYQVASNNVAYSSINNCLYDKEGAILYSVPSGLTAVEIADSAKTIFADAFNGTKIEALVIPSNVKTLAKGALNGANHLVELTTPVIGDGKDNKYMLHLFGATKSLTSDQKISFDTTYVPAALRKITITGEINTIDEFAFYALSNVEEINILSDVITIERYAYYNSGISEYTFGPTVKTVGDFAFANCVNITEAYLPRTIENLGTGIYSSLPRLTRIEFEEGIEKIPNQICFPYAESVAVSIVQTEYVYYSSLTDIIIPSTVKEIGDLAFPYAGVYNNKPVGFSITFKDIQNSKLEVIGVAAFEEAALPSKLVLPASLKKVSGEAFAFSSTLTSIEFGTKEQGSSLEEIEGMAFYNCSALTTVIINKAVVEDEDVPQLTIHSLLDNRGNPVEYTYHFAGCPASIKISVNNAEKYKTNALWSDYIEYIYEIDEEQK